MMTDNQDRHDLMTDWLFATGALTVAPAGHPFWYTSGMLGPYYINTHYLCGGEAAAIRLLSVIEQALADPINGLPLLTNEISAQIDQSDVYRQVIDRLAELAASCTFNLISGGERRDLFFSLPVALQLKKPHLTVLKDGSAWYQQDPRQIPVQADAISATGQTTVHIADLVTEASSYLRAWLPAVRRLGLTMADTLAVVDRGQGGRDVLAAEQVRLRTLTVIENQFFESACQRGRISRQQMDQILDFSVSPLEYTRSFISGHPDFLGQELAAGGQRWERAQRCLALLGLPTDQPDR